MKINKLCLSLSCGLLGFCAASAFADTQSSNDFNIAYEGITTNFDKHGSSMAQRLSSPRMYLKIKVLLIL